MFITKKCIVYFILLLSCLMLGKSFILKKIITNIEETTINNIRKQEINLTNEVAYHVENEFGRLYNDIEYIANSPCASNDDDGINVEKATNMARAFLNFYDFYTRISFIDINGREILAIESNKKQINEVPPNKLRSLSNDIFFKDSIKNKYQDILISNINYDNNFDDYSRATIDISTPILNKNKQKLGIIILTYNFSEIVNRITSQYTLSYGDGYTIDNDGYWITSASVRNPDSININFKEENNTVFSLFSRNKGQTFHDSRLYTFNEIIPFRKIFEKSKTNKWKDPLSAAMATEIARKAGINTRWIAYTEVNQEKIYTLIEKNLTEINSVEKILNYVVIILSLIISILWAQKDIASQNLELNAVVKDVTNDSVIMADKNGLIISTNRAFTQIMGYSAKEATKQPFHKFYANKNDINKEYEYLKIAKEHGRWHGELWKRRKDGVAIPTVTTISFIHSWRKSRGIFVEISSDISNFKETEAYLKAEASHDPLTGMPNRLLFDDRFSMAVKHSKRSKNKFAIVYIDLNKFKPINDEYGHENGDVVLRECAKRLLENLRDNDTIARIGGDEFAVILENIRSNIDVENIIGILRKQISRDITLPEGYIVNVGASFGYAIYPDDTNSADDLVKIADQNMYKEKRASKKRI